MDSWENRPLEVAYLLNPAFCGEVLCQAIKEYNRHTSISFPYPLLFLILPIILHRSTRTKIGAQRQMYSWLQTYPEVKINFAARAKHFVPITKEAINFLLQVKAIEFDETAGIALVPRSRKSVPLTSGCEVDECYKKAKTLGRWLARAGAPVNNYVMWGVKP
jgi:hypothetical protein